MNDAHENNPLLAQMRRNLQTAEAQLADDERLRADRASGNALAWFVEHFWHWFAMCLSLSVSLGAAAWCYYLLNTVFAAGRAMAIGVGMLNAIVFSYVSRYSLASTETTYEGQVELDGMSFFDWKEWFWTLPTTAGVVVWGALIEYFVSLFAPEHRALITIAAILLTHPFFVLSTLANESPLNPVSWQLINKLQERIGMLFGGSNCVSMEI